MPLILGANLQSSLPRNFELIKLQKKHISEVAEQQSAYNTKYFSPFLANRKGWQRKMDKTQREANLRSMLLTFCKPTNC